MMQVGNKTVRVLTKTVECLNITTLYADNLFTGIVELLEYLEDKYVLGMLELHVNAKFETQP